LIKYDLQPLFNTGSPDKRLQMIMNEARKTFTKLQAWAHH